MLQIIQFFTELKQFLYIFLQDSPGFLCITPAILLLHITDIFAECRYLFQIICRKIILFLKRLDLPFQIICFFFTVAGKNFGLNFLKILDFSGRLINLDIQILIRFFQCFNIFF